MHKYDLSLADRRVSLSHLVENTQVQKTAEIFFLKLFELYARPDLRRLFSRT